MNAGNNAVTSPALPSVDLDGLARVTDGTVDLGPTNTMWEFRSIRSPDSRRFRTITLRVTENGPARQFAERTFTVTVEPYQMMLPVVAAH